VPHNIRPIRILTVGPAANGFAERALRYANDLQLVGAASDWRSALERRGELRPDVLLLEARPDTDDTIAAIETFAQRALGVAVIVLDALLSLASLRRGMLAGAAAYLALPPTADELLLALRRAGSAAVVPPGASERRSTVIAVCSPKGGAGCSTLAVNLALALGRNAATVVVDGDPQGDLEVLLDLPPGPTLAELFASELDAAAINDAALPHSGGIRALLAPPGALGRAEIDPQRLRAVLEALRGSFRHIVVDAGTVLDDRVFTIMEAADRVVVVITPQPAAFRRLTSFWELAIALGIDKKLLVVLNRYNREHMARLEGVERTLGRAFDHHVGDAPREMAIAATDGVPLLLARPDHPVARDIAGLAASLARVSG